MSAASQGVTALSLPLQLQPSVYAPPPTPPTVCSCSCAPAAPHTPGPAQSPLFVVPALPWLQKSIHQQRRWEQTMTLDFPFGLLRLLSLLSRTQLLLQCLYIERHFDIHSVLLHVTIGNTDDGTVHPSCRPRSDQFGNASFSFVFFFLQSFISLPLFSFSFPSMVEAHFHKYSFQAISEKKPCPFNFQIVFTTL